MILLPGTGMVVGAGMNCGMISVIAVDDQFGDGEQGALVGRIRKFGNNGSRLIDELLGAVTGTFDAAIVANKAQNGGERHGVVAFAGQHGFDRGALLA